MTLKKFNKLIKYEIIKITDRDIYSNRAGFTIIKLL